MLRKIFNTEKLVSSACGKTPWIEKREAAPGADWLEAGPQAIVRCHCGLTRFNGHYADGFLGDNATGYAWNSLMGKVSSGPATGDRNKLSG